MAGELDDSAMLLELKIWMDGARAALPGHPKIRYADEHLSKINNIAEQLKAEALEKLSVLERRYEPDLQTQIAPGSVAGSFSKANTKLDTYARERQVIVDEFSARNDGLWRTANGADARCPDSGRAAGDEADRPCRSAAACSGTLHGTSEQRV